MLPHSLAQKRGQRRNGTMKKRTIPKALIRQCTRAICKASLLCAASELKAARILPMSKKSNNLLWFPEFIFKVMVTGYYPVAVVPRLVPTMME